MKHKYKTLSLLICMLMIAFNLTACASNTYDNYDDTSGVSSQNELTIVLQLDNAIMKVNSIEKEIDPGRGTTPVIKNERTIVPIRAIIEEFGGTVDWNEQLQAVTLKYNGSSIKLFIDSTKAYVNDVEKTLDVAPTVINGRTLLPIRFISENFGFYVEWDDKTSSIIISNQEITKPVLNVKQNNETDSSVIDNSKKLIIHFIDVGQGDAIFSELPNGETLLIDAGPTAGIVAPYISGLGYTSITYVVATHPDADHITGIPEVLNNFHVDRFYMPEKEHTTNIFNTMLDCVEKNGCDAVYARSGKEICSSAGLNVSFVAPCNDYADNNAMSAVVKIAYGSNSVLLTGDAEYSSENDMISSGQNLSADILKVGHHGSKSSTSSIFLEAVNPKVAIISVGQNNKYGHPTPEIIQMLKNKGIEIYRTDEFGTIILTSDGTNYTLEKSKSPIKENAPPNTAVPANVTQSSSKSTVQNNVVNSNDNNSDIVYKTKTGKCYHKDGCSYLKSKIQTTVSEAKKGGLTPCSRCNPPE